MFCYPRTLDTSKDGASPWEFCSTTLSALIVLLHLNFPSLNPKIHPHPWLWVDIPHLPLVLGFCPDPLSLSQVVGSMPTSGSAGSVPENLNLFPEPGGKGEEVGKKQLSKDSILSLYGSQTSQVPAQGNPGTSWDLGSTRGGFLGCPGS